MSTAPKPLGKATYVASDSDKEWLQSVQRKLYTQSWDDLDYVFRKLWGLVTDLRNLRCALARVSRNRGSRTAGVDGITVRQVLAEAPPIFASSSMESPVHSERCTPGSARGVRKPTRGQPG